MKNILERLKMIISIIWPIVKYSTKINGLDENC